VARAPLGCRAGARSRALWALSWHVQGRLDHGWPPPSCPSPGLEQRLGDSLPTGGDRDRGPELSCPLHPPHCHHQQSSGKTRQRAGHLPLSGQRESHVETPHAARRSVSSSFPSAWAATGVYQSPRLRHPEPKASQGAPTDPHTSGRRPQQRLGPNTSSAPRPPTVLACLRARAALPELWGGTRGREAPRASSPRTTLDPRDGERVSQGAVNIALDRAYMPLLCRLRGLLWPGHAHAPKAACHGSPPGGHISLSDGIEGVRSPLVPPLCAAGVPRFPASTASPPH
jgi:hypothetical protein